MKNRIYSISALLCAFLSNSAFGDIADFKIADVTASSFAVVFSSTVAVVAPDIKIYQDEDGLVELTADHDVVTGPLHHLNGLSTLRVHSLDPATTYYFNFTDDSSASPYFPSSALPAVTTYTLAPAPAGSMVSNDLIKLDIYKPDQIASLEGAVVLLSLPSVSLHPVSSFVNVNGFAYVDANNLLQGDAAIQLLEEGNSLEINVMRGLLCAGTVDHLQVFYRKQGEDLLEGGQVNMANQCNPVDTVCDDQIDVLDVQFVLNALNSTPAECRFTAELDVVPDQQVDVLDVQQILNFF